MLVYEFLSNLRLVTNCKDYLSLTDDDCDRNMAIIQNTEFTNVLFSLVSPEGFLDTK